MNDRPQNRHLLVGGVEHSTRGPSCPHCKENTSNVKDSRQHTDDKGRIYVRRRRLCQSCGERFTTFETTYQKLLTIDPDLRRRLTAMRTEIDFLLKSTPELT